MGKSDQGPFLGDQIFHIDLTLILDDLGAPLVRILFFNFEKLLFNDGVNLFLAGQDAAEFLDFLDHGQIFLLDLLPL